MTAYALRTPLICCGWAVWDAVKDALAVTNDVSQIDLDLRIAVDLVDIMKAEASAE
jgi:hypothetical protein